MPHPGPWAPLKSLAYPPGCLGPGAASKTIIRGFTVILVL